MASSTLQPASMMPSHEPPSSDSLVTSNPSHFDPVLNPRPFNPSAPKATESPSPTPVKATANTTHSTAAQPICQNCATSTTPLWRRDESGQVLCNACGLFLKLHGRARPISLKTDVIKSRNRIKHHTGAANTSNANLNTHMVVGVNNDTNHNTGMSSPNLVAMNSSALGTKKKKPGVNSKRNGVGNGKTLSTSHNGMINSSESSSAVSTPGGTPGSTIAGGSGYMDDMMNNSNGNNGNSGNSGNNMNSGNNGDNGNDTNLSNKLPSFSSLDSPIGHYLHHTIGRNQIMHNTGLPPLMNQPSLVQVGGVDHGHNHGHMNLNMHHGVFSSYNPNSLQQPGIVGNNLSTADGKPNGLTGYNYNQPLPLPNQYPSYPPQVQQPQSQPPRAPPQPTQPAMAAMKPLQSPSAGASSLPISTVPSISNTITPPQSTPGATPRTALDRLSSAASESPYLAAQTDKPVEAIPTTTKLDLVTGSASNGDMMITGSPKLSAQTPSGVSSLTQAAGEQKEGKDHLKSSNQKNPPASVAPPPTTRKPLNSELSALRTRIIELELINDLYRTRISELEVSEYSARKSETLTRETEILLRNSVYKLENRNNYLLSKIQDLNVKVKGLKTVTRKLRLSVLDESRQQQYQSMDKTGKEQLQLRQLKHEQLLKQKQDQLHQQRQQLKNERSLREVKLDDDDSAIMGDDDDDENSPSNPNDDGTDDDDKLIKDFNDGFSDSDQDMFDEEMQKPIIIPPPRSDYAFQPGFNPNGHHSQSNQSAPCCGNPRESHVHQHVIPPLGSHQPYAYPLSLPHGPPGGALPSHRFNSYQSPNQAQGQVGHPMGYYYYGTTGGGMPMMGSTFNYSSSAASSRSTFNTSPNQVNPSISANTMPAATVKSTAIKNDSELIVPPNGVANSNRRRRSSIGGHETSRDKFRNEIKNEITKNNIAIPRVSAATAVAVATAPVSNLNNVTSENANGDFNSVATGTALTTETGASMETGNSHKKLKVSDLI